LFLEAKTQYTMLKITTNQNNRRRLVWDTGNYHIVIFSFWPDVETPESEPGKDYLQWSAGEDAIVMHKHTVKALHQALGKWLDTGQLPEPGEVPCLAVEKCRTAVELERMASNMAHIAKHTGIPFTGKWYECSVCGAHNLLQICGACGSTKMATLYQPTKGGQDE
jgi:hypothetical protein